MPQHPLLGPAELVGLVNLQRIVSRRQPDKVAAKRLYKKLEAAYPTEKAVVAHAAAILGVKRPGRGRAKQLQAIRRLASG